MGTRARPDVEDSEAALAERDRLPLLERFLFAKKNDGWTSSVGPKSFRTVTATSSPRSWNAAKADPSGDQEPLTQKWGWLLGRHTLPVIFQGFLSK
jgi:hypothetical protein